MNDEKITVRVTSTGQTMEVVVFSKRAEVITVVLGEGRAQYALLADPHTQRVRLRRERDGARNRHS